MSARPNRGVGHVYRSNRHVYLFEYEVEFHIRQKHDLNEPALAEERLLRANYSWWSLHGLKRCSHYLFTPGP